jgi:very-short-patch-repair endonuclease
MFYGATPQIFRFAEMLRKKMTPAEIRLWDSLSNNQLLNLKFRRQHPISKFIADFYCHEVKLVIELDGGIHSTSDQKEYDIGRSEELNQYEVTVIRFNNDEVLNEHETVLEKIKSECSRLLIAKTS